MARQNTNPVAGEKRPLGIYLHIPFCRHKCLYCDFLSACPAPGEVERYVDALEKEMIEEASAYRDFYVDTVFFGGGTPSLLDPEQIGQLLDCLRAHFVLSEEAEITLESNPGTLDFERLLGYRRAGVNRLSIGLQSASDAELKALGRIHSYSTFLDNYRAAREAGFSNINVDLMSALPGQTAEGWLDTLDKVSALSPEHISAYSLIIEEGTPFYDRYGEEGCARGGPWPALPDEDAERLMYERTEAFLRERGYRRYEISNYALPGRECRHNEGYWRRRDYAGFGLGASSLVNEVRWKRTDDLDEYLARWERGERRGQERQQLQALSEQERMEEFMFLGLRLTEGVTGEAFLRAFGKPVEAVYGRALERLEAQGLLAVERLVQGEGLPHGMERNFAAQGGTACGRIRLTPYGVDVSNFALAEFLLDEGGETE